MKIKLDENLPHRLATLLKKFGHDVHTLHEEGLTGHADAEVWEAAQKESRFLITRIWTSRTRESSLLVHTTASCSYVSARRTEEL